MKFSLVIPNFNGSRLLRKNLPKVIEAASGAEIIVVDDASTDESVRVLREEFPNVKIVRHQENQRFAKACNSGVDAAHGDIIVLLNSDVAPQRDFLKPFSKHFDSETVFAAGCMEIDGEKKRGKSTGRFERGMLVHSPAKDLKAGPTLWAFGGSAAFSREKWLELGGMDPLFRPAYWEDIDLSYRAWKRGWSVVFEPKSRVFHEPESTNVGTFGKKRIRRVAGKNQLLFVWKNIHDERLILMHLFWLPFRMLAALVKADGAFLIGMALGILQLREVLGKRRDAKDSAKVPDEAVLSRFTATTGTSVPRSKDVHEQ